MDPITKWSHRRSLESFSRSKALATDCSITIVSPLIFFRLCYILRVIISITCNVTYRIALWFRSFNAVHQTGIVVGIVKYLNSYYRPIHGIAIVSFVIVYPCCYFLPALVTRFQQTYNCADNIISLVTDEQFIDVLSKLTLAAIRFI